MNPDSHRDRNRSRTLAEDAQGFTILPVSDHNLQSHRARVRTRTVAITPCVVTTADGRSFELKRSRANRVTSTEPRKTVKTRSYFLRANVTDYLEVAERVGFDVHNVVRLYREHANNGYHYVKTVTTNETYGFRGQEV